MSPLRLLAATGLAAAIAGVTLVSASAATAPAAGITQNVSIVIRGGDRVPEANFAVAPGVTVRLAIRNYTHEFHTFTIPGLRVSTLVMPSAGHTPKTTIVEFTPRTSGAFVWRCAICPSGEHGRQHDMSGAVYVLVAPNALP